MAGLPETIKLNAIDRTYLVPETEDERGIYLPMSLVRGIDLVETLTADRLIAALQAVDAKYPQFRLGYTLDYEHEVWRKVPAADFSEHLASMVQTCEAGNHDTLVSQALTSNPDPLSRPVQIMIHGRTLIVKQQHSFGDGRFLMQMVATILLAAFDRAALNALPPLAMHFGLPMWRVMWQSPRQGIATLRNWIGTLRGTVQDFSGSEKAADKPQIKREPIRTGTPMQSVRYVLDAAVLQQLDTMRKDISTGDVKVSLNTILQVMFGHKLMAMGLQAASITYTLPVDLKRYLRHPAEFQAGNLAGQIKVTTTPRSRPDWRADCLEMQAKVDDQLRRGLPLAALPSEWLFRLAGRKTVRKYNREWLLSATQSDPRFFIMTNLGKLDADWGPVLPYLDHGSSISIGVPLMGSPPLVIALFTLAGQGHMTAVYNPAVVTREQIADVMSAMSVAWLAGIPSP